MRGCFFRTVRSPSRRRHSASMSLKPLVTTTLLARRRRTRTTRLRTTGLLTIIIVAACHTARASGGDTSSMAPSSLAATSTVLELLRDGHQLCAIRTSDSEGTITTHPCQKAVLCSGAWSAQLLPELKIAPVKGQMLSLQAPRGALRRVIFGPGTYMVPREDGLVVVGATSEPEAGFNEGLTPQGQITLKQGLTALLPEAAEWPPMERWWGFRPCTPDEGPLLGASAIEGLLLACGHHRNGVLMASATAELIADLASGAEPLSDLADLVGQFRWDRWTKP